jgi:hypothetical protein
MIATRMASNSDEISCETSGFCHVHVRLDLQRKLFWQKKKRERKGSLTRIPWSKLERAIFVQNLLFNSSHFLESKVSYLF